jgi:hypothetical protein
MTELVLIPFTPFILHAHLSRDLTSTFYILIRPDLYAGALLAMTTISITF